PCVLVRATTPVVQKEPSMDPQVTATDLAEDPETRAIPEIVTNDADVATEAERHRIMGILSACEAARLPMSTARKLIDEKKPLVDAQTIVLDLLRKRGADDQGPRPGPSRVAVVGADPLETVWRGITGALLHRMAPQ